MFDKTELIKINGYEIWEFRGAQKDAIIYDEGSRLYKNSVLGLITTFYWLVEYTMTVKTYCIYNKFMNNIQ